MERAPRLSLPSRYHDLEYVICKDVFRLFSNGIEPRVLQNLQDGEAVQWVFSYHLAEEIPAVGGDGARQDVPLDVRGKDSLLQHSKGEWGIRVIVFF